jgi:hypothetical protein
MSLQEFLLCQPFLLDSMRNVFCPSAVLPPTPGQGCRIRAALYKFRAQKFLELYGFHRPDDGIAVARQ